jgi:hypothetical protein
MRAMRRVRSWLARWLGNANFSAARYLRNVVVAVLFVPVLPDIMVDAFGGDEPRWLNPSLRMTALLVIVVGLVLFNRWQLWLAARRAAASVGMHRMRQYPVVVLPMGPRQAVYRESASRGGDPSSTEVIVDRAKPALVVAMTTDAVSDENLDEVRTGLRARGIKFETVLLDDPTDVEKAVPEGSAAVIEALRRHQVNPSDVCFDTTGGNVPMSLAMLHAAARYGSDCCYVSSKQEQGERLPKTQKVTTFAPAVLAAGQ